MTLAGTLISIIIAVSFVPLGLIIYWAWKGRYGDRCDD